MPLTLTEERRVAWRIQGIGPDPAHAVVVLKKVGTGKTLHRILQPGEILKLAWLESVDSYVAYAISNDENLQHSFTRKYQWVNPIKTFMLHFNLDFRVSDAELLALKLEGDDPLKRLEEQVARVLSATARHLPWEMLKEEAPNFGLFLLAAESTAGLGERKENFERLLDFAAKLGLELRNVDVTRSLTEADLQIPLTEEETAIQIKLAELKGQVVMAQGHLKHQQEALRDDHQWDRDLLAAKRRQILEGMERLRMVLDGIAREGVRAVSQPVDGVRSFPALHDALVEIQNIQASLAALSGGQAYMPSLNAAAGNSSVRALPSDALIALPSISDPAERLVSQAICHLRVLSENAYDHRRILATVLHLIAEASLGLEADEEFLTAYRDDLAGRLRPVESALGDEQVTFFRSIMNLEELRRTLA